MPVRDVRGQTFESDHPQRIVSLVPSLTEALFAFGAGDRVVGVTDFCIHPQASVASKTRIGGTKNPRVDRILALAPDLVIANVEENRKVDVDALEARGVPVFVTFPRTVRAAIDELRDLALLVGAAEPASVVEPIEAALARLGRPRHRPRVFIPIWRDPWMTANADTYIGDLIETCGGANVFGARERRFPLAADLAGAPSRAPEPMQDTRYPRVSLAEVAAAQPEIILLPDEPYRFTQPDADELHATPGLEQARIHLIDGTLVSWYGVRMARALATLPRILGPE